MYEINVFLKEEIINVDIFFIEIVIIKYVFLDVMIFYV